MGRPPLALGTYGRVTAVLVSPGRWRARARYRDWDGVTRVVERLGPTRGQASAALAIALRDRSAPVHGATIAPDTKLEVLLETWVSECVGAGKAPSTITTYRSAARSVSAALGSLRAREVSVAVAERHLISVAAKTPGQARTQRVALMGAMGVAVRHGAVPANPVEFTANPRRAAGVKRVEAPTAAEMTALREAAYLWEAGRPAQARPVIGDLWTLMIGTGFRISEALGLRWCDVDLLTVPATATVSGIAMPGGGARIERAKSARAFRTVALPSSVAAMLAHRRGVHGGPDDGPVFASRSGAFYSTNNVRSVWRRFIDESGVEDRLTFHGARRGVATLLDGAAGIQVAQEQLGHSRSAVTLDHYVARPVNAPDSSAILEGLTGVNGG